METITHNGVSCILGKVHLLPSENKAKMYKGSRETNNTEEMDSMVVEKYFYITTDEEIKEANWCIQIETGEIFKIKEVIQNRHLYLDINDIEHWDNFDPWCCRKIISSNDTILIADGVPQIPQSFIQDYCKIGEIEKVMVEYIKYAMGVNGLNPMEPKPIYKLKKDSNNEIITHNVEEKMYTATQVKELIRDSNYAIGRNHYPDGSVDSLNEGDYDQFIKENL